ncbi:DUF3800 domain-containing protein [Bradyrhizobium sp. Pha-3]|uniref:DUF3800 domain-containing protein n=1 Tax=Bradyrhizobium sp. Pha-3 TaxID=208375 RepID=UPI0035D47700
MISADDPLQAFVDASGKGDPNVLVVAGYVARAGEWAKFSEAWKEKLGQRRLRRFKMNEMAQQLEFVAYFYRTIEEHDILAAISCVFDTAALVRFVDEFVPPSPGLDIRALKNPYLYAARQIVENLALTQEKMGLKGPVDFVFDNEAEEKKLSPHWDRFRASLRSEVGRLMGRNPTYRDDEKCMPLQAADLWAWWVRKWYEDGNENGVKQIALPWGAKREIKRLHSVYDEAFFRSALQNSLTR